MIEFMKEFDYDFDKAYQYLVENCEIYGIEKIDGTGKILKEGKPYDLSIAVHECFSNSDSKN